MNDFTLGALAGTVLGAVWNKVQRLFAWITGLLIVRVEAGGAQLAGAAEWYCWTHMKHTRSPFYRFQGMYTWVRSLDRGCTIISERAGGAPQLFWCGWRPLLLSAVEQAQNDRNAPQSVSPDHGTMRFSFIRGTFNADEVMQLMLATFNEYLAGTSQTHNRRFSVIKYAGMGGMSNRNFQSGQNPMMPYIPPSAAMAIQGRVVGIDRSELGDPLSVGQPVDRLALSAEALSAVADIKRWAKSRAWYRQRQIAWRRGMLLHGAPGTGKSSVVKALAQDLDWPICVFDVATMSNGELGSYWQQASTQSPCVVLIEDIDAVFDGRTNALGEQGGGLTFDCLLNTLSGVSQIDGILVVITTNRRERLDVALAGGYDDSPSRPGRIDLVVEMGPPDLEGRKLIARNILVDRPDLVDRLAAECDGQSGAQFQERCIHEALTDFWLNSVSLDAAGRDPLIISRVGETASRGSHKP